MRRPALSRVMMRSYCNYILSSGGRPNGVGSISVTAIPRRHDNQKLIIVKHVLIEIAGLGGVGVNIGSPRCRMNLGIGKAGGEELAVEGQAEGSIAITNVGKGNLGPGSDSVGHAGAVKSSTRNGTCHVRAMSIFIIRIINKIHILGKLSSCRVHSATSLHTIIPKVTIILIHTRITKRHNLPTPIQPHIKKRPLILQLTLRQPLNNGILRAHPFPTFERAYIWMRCDCQ
mmetsp:Transcript_17744/g.38333  ORF Transcript_17744/g.38333 Transcript_17744/m.38333 type:complete len:230 (-) Transcript_17744:1192-1881(-)